MFLLIENLKKYNSKITNANNKIGKLSLYFTFLILTIYATLSILIIFTGEYLSFILLLAFLILIIPFGLIISFIGVIADKNKSLSFFLLTLYIISYLLLLYIRSKLSLITNNGMIL